MPEVESYAPGTPCWVELATTDSRDAKRFYSALFGWTTFDSPIGPDQYYTMLRLRDKDVAALFQSDPAPGTAPAPAWRHYFSVASVDDAAAKATALGAKLLQAPFDVMEAGRMATLVDPTGARFALWQPGRHPGAALVNEPGAWCWNELVTANAGAAGDFYRELFGWDAMTRDMGGWHYTTFTNQGRPIAGMLQPAGDQAQPPSWLAYFAVADCDATLHHAQDLGATLLAPPRDAAGVGRFAVLADPQGAAFAIIALGTEAL